MGLFVFMLDYVNFSHNHKPTTMKKTQTKTSKVSKPKAKPQPKARGKAKPKNIKEEFLKAFHANRGIISMACEAVGISRSTYYNWLQADSIFAEAVEDVREVQIDRVEGHLLNLIESGDTTATIFYLKTRGKARGYSERQELAITANPFVDLMNSLDDPEE